MLGEGGVTGQIRHGGRTGTALWWAARDACLSKRRRAVDMARLLVNKGADVNAAGSEPGGNESTPLWLAAKAAFLGVEDVVHLAKLLVARDADVKAVGSDGDGSTSTALWWVAMAVWSHGAPAVELVELAKLLMAKGAEINAAGKLQRGNYVAKESMPLWWAVWAVCDGEPGGLEMTKLLVMAGADVNAVGHHAGWRSPASPSGIAGTPIWLAAQGMRDGKVDAPELARLLISAGARLADDEKEEFQVIIDGVTGGVKRNMHESDIGGEGGEGGLVQDTDSDGDNVRLAQRFPANTP